jgi:hypothetical protein
MYHKHKLHSGRGKNGKKGRVVKNKKQAKAILLSYLRKEGKIGSRKKKHKKAHKKRTISKR